MNNPGVKRLIEVDLPIRAISTHARREKSIRHGHISTLHMWWARRPLAACRAVLCAALWPDPADEACPQSFRDAAALILASFAEQVRNNRELAELSADHWQRWNRTNLTNLHPKDPAAWNDMRYALLDFIADFANWDASTLPSFLETSRLLTHAAHLSLTLDDFQVSFDQSIKPQELIERLKVQMEPLPRPLVVDPFAGGGSIPLEALRIGADAFASDLNPVAVLLNKVVLEYIPKYGNRKIEIRDESSQPVTLNGLAEAVRYWGNWIKQQAEKELAEFYPKDPDGATPIAYLWARTINCEGPGCGVEIPLITSLWLAKKGDRSVALQLVPDRKNNRVNFEIIEKYLGKWVRQNNHKSEIKKPQFDGTVRRGSATCPVCGFTTPVNRVRAQLKKRHGGSKDARLFCVVTIHPNEPGRVFRLPSENDLITVQKAYTELEHRKSSYTGKYSLLPEEPTPQGGGSGAGRAFSQRLYGMYQFDDMFTTRQLLAMSSYVSFVKKAGELAQKTMPEETVLSTQVVLGLALSRFSDICNAYCRWQTTKTQVRNLFTRQAIGMVWDFAEPNILADAAGNFDVTLGTMLKVIERTSIIHETGHVEMSDAITHPLPNDSSYLFFTDPPYYDSVPYSDLSDFFYVWLKRSIPESLSLFLTGQLTPKDAECIVDEVKHKDSLYFEKTMGRAMVEGRRVLSPTGIGTVVFAHKSTSGWEALLKAMIDAGWTVTGSWPIDTESETRLRAQGSAALASSIHLVCRPRETVDGSLSNSVGDWRQVLAELPARIHAWLPRLAAEGVVGADAIFACLGPALEIYSRYSRVETASGEQVSLKQYLEVVWAAVAREALGMIFQDADATGFEEDARLTAIWLWTLTASGTDKKVENIETDDDDSEAKPHISNINGYALEYDAARKIAQGLGAHLEKLTGLAQVKGDQARLLSVRERSSYLLGRENNGVLQSNGKPSASQLDLFAVLTESTDTDSTGWDGDVVLEAGSTTLDRLHQSMILFGVGRGEALKRFLVENGVGKEARFWRLAQALSALYPSGSDEKRWVDGVLARKRGLGF